MHNTSEFILAMLAGSAVTIVLLILLVPAIMTPPLGRSLRNGS